MTTFTGGGPMRRRPTARERRAAFELLKIIVLVFLAWLTYEAYMHSAFVHTESNKTTSGACLVYNHRAMQEDDDDR